MNYLGTDWVCDEGYKKDYSTGQCIKVACGPNEYLGGWNKDTCYCKDGYKRNYTTGKCEKIICGENEYLSTFWNECFCKDGYTRDYLTGKCVKEQ